MTFSENLELFQQENPGAAVKLSFIDPPKIEIPKQDSNTWFSSLALDNIDVLYIFGIDQGNYLEPLKPWLYKNPNRKVVFLEDELTALYHFLHQENAKKLLTNPQVKLYYFSDVEEDQNFFDRITWQYILCQISLSAIPFYAEKRKEIYGKLKSKLLFESAMKNDIVDEFLKGGASYFKNFYKNLVCLHESYDAQKMFGQYKNTPAIICGAGPSLQKNLDLLTTLKDKALIFAGGSAMNAVNQKSFKPHFGAGIDPNSEQYERYKTQKASGVPYFYRNRLEHRAFQSIEGPKIYVKGAGAYPIANWFDEKLGIEGETLDEGHNIVNFCAEIAAALGCNPIIFVGLDLAYTDMKTYAEGVINETATTQEEITKQKSFELTAQLKEDIHGNQVYTLWKWMAESKWLTEFSSYYSDQKVINASEGGLGIENVENLTLQEVSERYLQKSYDLSIDLHPIKVSCQQIQEALLEFQTSLKRSIDLIISIETATKSHDKALFEVELSEEPAFFALLELFSKVYLHIHPGDEKGSYSFLKEVAALNLNLLNQQFRGAK